MEGTAPSHVNNQLLKYSVTQNNKEMIEAQTSTTRYPQCLAATCASVVFPSPGGPHSRSTCRSKKLMTLQLIGNPPGIFCMDFSRLLFFLHGM